MGEIEELRESYEALNKRLLARGEEAIAPGCLLAFDYQYPEQPAEVVIETEEFTAVCPWTGLPDYGTLTITYLPRAKCVELKSLKYYLLSYRDVGILQEHAANLVLRHLVALCQPRYMKVTLDYKVRGGIHSTVTVEHKGPETGSPA